MTTQRADRFVRFRDLKARGLLSNHVTLQRWIKYEGFPPGMMLGPNTRVWRESEIEAWLASRSTKNDRFKREVGDAA